MALSFPITFSLSPIPSGVALDGNEYGQQLVANLQATISGSFLTGQIGGLPPTQDVGPWANNGHWWFWDAGTSTYIQESLTSTFPTGMIAMFGGTTAPTGFLLCNGSVQLIATFPGLFSVIGTSFNPSAASGTFNVPDYRGRSPIGSGSGTGLTTRVIGGNIGVENQSLSIANLAAHNHAATSSSTSTSSWTENTHTHQQIYPNASSVGLAGGISPETVFAAGSSSVTTSASGSGLTSIHTNTSTTTSVNNAGSGTAHNNIQPSLVCNFIIKT